MNDDRVRQVAAALIWRDGRFMICRRPMNKARGGLFEFPGGKAEEGESINEALIRECREELDITVKPGSVYMELDHVYPDISIHLVLINCEIEEGEPKLLEHSELLWIKPQDAKNYAFCPADADIIERLGKEK